MSCTDSISSPAKDCVLSSAIRDLSEAMTLLKDVSCSTQHEIQHEDRALMTQCAAQASSTVHQVMAAASTAQQSQGPFEDTWIAIKFRLCGVLLDVAICKRCDHCDEVDAALNLTRQLQSWLVSCASSTSDVMCRLLDVVLKRTLGEEQLRRIAALCCEVLLSNLEQGSDLHASTPAAAATDVLVAAMSVSGGCGLDFLQILLEALAKHMEKLADASANSCARSLALILVQVLGSISGRPATCVAWRDWMPQAFNESRQGAQTVAVTLIRAISHGTPSMASFVENVIMEIANLAAQPELPAAVFVLRSLVGSLIVLLRSRGVGDIKIFAVRALGNIMVRLTHGFENLTEELCESCLKTESSCPCCQEPEKGFPHTCRRGPSEAHSDAFSTAQHCDLCLSRIAAAHFNRQFQCAHMTADSKWTIRYLVLLACCQSCGHKSQQTSMTKSRARGLEQNTASACNHYLCSWTVDVEQLVEGTPLNDTENTEQERYNLESLCESFSRCVSDSGAHSLGLPQVDSTRMLRPFKIRLGNELRQLHLKWVRAILLQIRSPRVKVRAAALRSLCAIVEHGSNINHDAWQHLFRAPQLLPTLSDVSAHVRHAAITLTSRMFLEHQQPSLQNANSYKRALTALQAACGDPSVAVKTAAQRLLGLFVRNQPDDPSSPQICIDLVTRMCSCAQAKQSKLLEDIHHYIFHSAQVLRSSELLHLLAIAHRANAGWLCSGILQMCRSCGKHSEPNVAMQELAWTLLQHFASNPKPQHMAGLVALSNAVPGACTGHAQIISAYLAISRPPSANEEVLALGACSVLFRILASTGETASQALSQSTWDHLDVLVQGHSSRLARPAMQCLCAAARAEGCTRMILKHVLQAVQFLDAEVSTPQDAPGLMRAAWIAATACEHCDLDTMVPRQHLSMTSHAALHLTSGRAVASVLSQIVHQHVSSKQHNALPALMLALGFALSRHVAMVSTPQVQSSFKHAFAVAPGCELLAERALEAYTYIVDRLIGQAESFTKTNGMDSLEPATAAQALTAMASHQSAIIRLLSYGLHRRPEAADVPIRSSALAAVHSLQKAGVCHPYATSCALFAPMIADRSCRGAAGLLLCSLAKQDSSGVAAALLSGLHEAFCAVLWQIPHQFILTRRDNLSRGLREASRAFSCLSSVSRSRWIKDLLSEFHSMHAKSFLDKFSVLPPNRPEPVLCRLTPFGGRKRKQASQDGSSENSGKQEEWQPSERLVLMYASFIATLLSSLQISDDETQLVLEHCNQYLEVRATGVLSALEHGTCQMDHSSVFAVCATTAVCRSILYAYKLVPGSARTDAFGAALDAQLPALAQATRGVDLGLFDWLSGCLDEGSFDLARHTKRKRLEEVAASRRRHSDGMDLPQDEVQTPPKQSKLRKYHNQESAAKHVHC